ncbi:MAG: hypothetical protein LBU85_12560 [Treponema sp.]|jgi:hypothetical protein|nr:hypothetical protein [Treponema sp.]
MKKAIFLLFFIAVIMNTLSAQEMQFSFGPEVAFGVYKVNSDIAFSDDANVHYNGYLFNVDATTLYLAPGINFSMRYLFETENSALMYGVFFRGRATFITNGWMHGKVTDKTFTNVFENVRDKYSIADGDSLTGIMDFDFGLSDCLKLSKRVSLCGDLGVNFTIMDEEDFKSKDTLSYWGVGYFANMALQVNITQNMFLEFGFNTIYNAFSSQKGEVNPENFGVKIKNKMIDYEDTGRWDLVSIAASINIGWRYDLKGNKLKNAGKNTEASQETAISD